MPVKNSKAEKVFPVRGARAGRLPEDDWSLDTATLQAWAAMQRELEAQRVTEAAEEIPVRASSTSSAPPSTDRAERRRQRWATIRAKSGAGDGVG